MIGEQEHRIDMKSIEPYKRVISHGGSHTNTSNYCPGILYVLTFFKNIFAIVSLNIFYVFLGNIAETQQLHPHISVKS